MRRKVLVLVTLALATAAACNTPGNGDAIDAAPTGDGTGNSDGGGPCMYLYLNFEGATLTAGNEDSSANTSSVTGQQTSTIPPFQNGVAGRDTLIASVTAQVRGQLQPLGVQVVTTRPSSGDYVMMVIGGTATDVGFSTQYTWLAPAIGCGPVTRAIGLVFENPSTPDYAWGNTIVGTYGITLGVPSSAQANDCMCTAAVECDSTNAACTIGSAGTARDHDSPCGSGTTYDEHADWVDSLVCL